MEIRSDFLVIGSGIAGLSFALKVCKYGSVTIVTKRDCEESSTKYAQGGIIEKESPIAISNVLLLCPKCSKPTKIGVSLLESGKKHRMCKKCKEVID